MIKALIAIILTLFTALVGVVWINHRVEARLDTATERVAILTAEQDTLVEALKQAQERSKRDAKVLVAREAQNASQARKLAQTQQALSEALQTEIEWSDTDVPTEVQKALSGPSSGLPAGGLRDN